MKKKFFLLILGIIVSIGLYAQKTTRNVDIIKSNPQVNFNNDANITNNASNTLTVDGAVFVADDGLTVDGASGLIISRLILKNSKLTAISSTGDTLTFYTKASDLIDGNSVFVVYSSGTGVPSTTPSRVGLLYYDTTNKKLYFSTGTSSSSDWTIAN
jgi:general stress protein 26